MTAFSFARLVALLRKELIQILRDTMTLRIIILIPIMQLFLFGYAINSDPKHLPAGILSIEDFEIHPHDRRGAQQFGLLRSSCHPVGGGGGSGTCPGRLDVRRRNPTRL